MILSQNLRKGTTFLLEGVPNVVLDYTHIKMARSDATIRVKVKNIKTGVIKEVTFNSSQKFDEADLENKNLQYLYDDGNALVFMDPETYEQISYDKEIIGDRTVLLTEGDSYQLQLFEGTLIDVLFPKSMNFKVSYTEPGFKGDTSSNTLKPAKLENGIEVQVPLFINIGDTVRINTDTLSYKERVTKG